ncbi:hypothetical protein CEUSTIGMA_g1050.t1 [Chlamydomonas eustigma]|uniref:Glycylpeptide N-tetradecanoyltransferase n=1 Tax=Chlamydomonas eustigma TaxID=1157962 RepID=A0A250WSC6_9CHLO|nr:hypothetical protein CEUSTIGMA_g1050.t1 [Chlamydomonas eustigma]|eukprot:GAX73599.1 hypothetical protein CEUSTIGMA_g1050.t1 [Chlamydomonas eustigma]
MAGSSNDEHKNLKIDPLEMQALQASVNQLDTKKQIKGKYAFWETQPVAQFKEDLSAQTETGPIDPPKTVAEVKQEPYNLPSGFEWCTCNLNDEAVTKEVYELLSNNYVEDDDNMFRFNYSPEFLKWALQPPGFLQEWLMGVRVSNSKKLVGFISAIPARIKANSEVVKMVEINFLCVHKKLRSKRLAPVLIKEVTRRVNLQAIWQAAYTAGVLIPKPIGTCRYWHRSLNPKKLIDVGFSRLAPRMTMARTIKLYKLPDEPLTPGLRPIKQEDVPQVTDLLNKYLAKFRITQVFDEQEVAHWFRCLPNVVEAYVVESPTGVITDLVSFYNLPSSILGHPEHTELNAAYMYYTVPGSVSIKDLMTDAMIVAKNKGYDVFNALNLLENETFLKDLKFGIGDGNLHYYLFNWRMGSEVVPSEVGLILM